MHILFLSPYPPCPPRSGGALRIYNLLIGLAQRHQVTCLTFAPDAAAVAALEPLRKVCHLVTVWDTPRRSLARRAATTLASPLPDLAFRNRSPTYAAVLRGLLARQSFDMVQAESLEMADYGLLARSAAGCLVLDEFNAEYVLQKRAALTDLASLPRPRASVAAAYSLVQWVKLAAYERRMLRRYDRVLVVSEEDRRALQRLRPQAQPVIVPNGVDSDYFSPAAPALSAAQADSRPSDDPDDLVFTGTLDFRPNVDALLWFVQRVLPLIRAQHPAARLVIVGRTPSAAVRALHTGDAVLVQPDVADVRPFIAGAAVYVVPMRMGGGVRLKLLEALAMQAAVVSTRMGAEGVPELRGEEHLLLADSAPEFAGAVLRLLRDAPLRRRLGAAGRALVTARYDWRVIVPRLEG